MTSKIADYFGIDFGTTNSATVGYIVLDNIPQLIKYGDDEGRPIPSVVAVEKETGRIFTGREAWEKRMALSETCEYIPSVKSLLDSEWKKIINGQEWTPIDIAAEVFRELKTAVSVRTGSVIRHATVAIPIGFSPDKRRKLREAAKKADIFISSFISEPTAAFFANYADLKSDSNVTVFDWGGGTLDISVLNHYDGRISELATSGMSVAGDDIDRKLAQRIHSKIARKRNINLSFEDMPLECQDILLVRAERAKRALCDDDTTTISINNYGEIGAFKETLDYDWFSEIINPEVDKAIECLKKTIEESEVGFANIDRIIMVGGSSNLRPLLEKMDKLFGEKLYFPEETMWNVGQGAGLLAVMPGTYCSNQDVGVKLSNGGIFKLLTKGTELKKWHRQVNFGIIDSSKEARFVFGGSNDLDESPEKYKTLHIPAYKFLQEQIIVNANVDDDLVFTVSAKSNMQPLDFIRFWEYSKLKFYYKLPQIKDGEGK